MNGTASKTSNTEDTGEQKVRQIEICVRRGLIFRQTLISCDVIHAPIFRDDPMNRRIRSQC
jgi:hypothetical protein